MDDTFKMEQQSIQHKVPAVAGLSPLWSCRLCWKITLAVFGLILGVESVIIVPSARYFERGELMRLAERTQSLVEFVLADARRRRILPDLDAIVGQEGLRGVAIRGPSGAVLASAGEVPATDLVPGATLKRQLVSTETGGRTLTAVWRSDLIPDVTVAARVDVGDLPQRLHAYLLRIAGLIAIIVLVVTVGTMLVLDRWLLRPLLRLRESALKAAATPDDAASFTLSMRRGDEMGDLIHAHNTMLNRVADSRRRDKEMAVEQAFFLTHHDLITGLPNRAALLEFLKRRCGMGHGVTVLLFNVLRFRALNATYGHAAADRLLHELARCLQYAASPDDFLAHVGADRFVIVRCGMGDPHVTAALAEKLLNAVSHPIKVADDVEVSLPVRVGIAQSDGNVFVGEDLLSQAELALVQTYEATTCKYQFYSPQFALAMRARQQLTHDLEQAILRREFFVVFQPKVKLLPPHDGAVLAGAEVLLRWQHPTRGLVNPAEFIPLAESTGLMGQIGDFVLRAAGEHIQRWHTRYGWSPRLAINVSGQEFSDPDLVRRIKRVVHGSAMPADRLELEVTETTTVRGAGESGIPTVRLELEITETTTMRDVEHSTQVLAELRKLGVHVSIDDFGTGYSSLNYLQRFMVDAIKIDKSFVDGIGHDHNAEVICDTILRIGHALGMRVIAEGVETEAQVVFLRLRKCNEAQGYLFGKPVTSEEFERTWLTSPPAAAAGLWI